MRITIPDNILLENNLSQQKILIDFACYLYDKELATMGQARHLANLDQISFQKALQERNIYLHITAEDFENDLKNLGLKA